MYVYVCIICIFVCINTYRNLVYKYTSMNVCNDCIDMCLQQSSHIKHDCFVCRASEFPKYLLVLFKYVFTNKKYVVHCHNGINCCNTNIQYWHMQCINIHIKVVVVCSLIALFELYCFFCNERCICDSCFNVCRLLMNLQIL